MSRYALLLIVLVIGVLMIHAVAFAKPSQSDILFYEYGAHECPHCSPMHEFLEKNYPGHHFFCDMSSDRMCAVYFTEFLKKTGLPGYIPQTIIVKNRTYILAIVIGEIKDKEFFDNLTLREPSTEIPIYEGRNLVGYLKLKNITVHRELVELLYFPNSSTHTTKPHTPSPPEKVGNNTSVSVIASLIPLALSDSVNPCTIAIYTTLLATVTIISRKRAIITGILFLLGVFIGYTLLGLSISYGLSFVNIPSYVLSLILIGFGLYLVLSVLLRRKEECRICKEDECRAERRKKPSIIQKLLVRAESTVLFAFILGLLLSFTLLPCSMGPYIVFLVSLAKSGEPALPYIIIYNIVFQTPLYVVLVSVTLLRKYVSIEKYRNWIYLVAGMILVLLGISYFIF